MATTKRVSTSKKEKKEKKATKPRVTAVEKKAATAPVESIATERYIYAVGRRKTAVAQVRFYPTSNSEGILITINGKSYTEYFKTFEQKEAVVSPLKAVGKESASFSVHVTGGGLSGQADAVKLGIARALVTHDILLRPLLRSNGLLTRDPRAVERKKPGLHKARRAPQWAKR